MNKLEEEQQNDLQQEVPANFQSMTNEQQILQKEKHELQCQIIDELNKQLAEAKYNLSLAKTYLATSQETVANLVIEKRKEMLKFSAEINRLKVKNVEVVGRFETAREKNIELSEKLKKEEERSSNFHDEVVKLKEKVAELEAELEIEFSIQNTNPQELAGEECKICPIKEAKITELKTSLEQANQDWKNKYQELEKSKIKYKTQIEYSTKWETKLEGLTSKEQEWLKETSMIYNVFSAGTYREDEKFQAELIADYNKNYGKDGNPTEKQALRKWKETIWKSEQGTSQDNNFVQELGKKIEINPSQLVDVISNLERMMELSQKTKSKNEKIVVNNLEVEEKSKENNQLQEKLGELSDNHSATTYHSQEVSDETDISESLKYSNFNSDDKDRKIVELQSELEEIKKQLETFQNEPGENNCLNECCINGDYEDIKREKNDLENKNDNLNLLLNEKSPVGSRKSTDLPEWNWFLDQRWLTDGEIDWALSRSPISLRKDFYNIYNIGIVPAYRFNYVLEFSKKGEDEFLYSVLLNEINDKSKELIFIPVNNPNFHWSLLVYEPESGKFYHFDTSKGANYNYAKPLVQDLLKQIHQNNEVELEKYFVKKHDIEQGNGYDCGVAVIALAERITEEGLNTNLSDLNKNFGPERAKWRKRVGEVLGLKNKSSGEEISTQTDLKKEGWENKEKQLINAKENYRVLQEEHKKTKDKLANSEEIRKSNEETIEELKSKIAEKEKVLMDQAKKRGESGELLEALTNERDEWQAKYESAINSAQTKQREAQNIQEELSERNNELSTQITNQQVENNQLNKKIETLEVKLFVLGNASQALLEEQEKVTKNLEKSQATNEFLTEQSRQKQAEIDSLNSEIGKIQTELDQVQQEKDRQQQRADDLEVNNVSLQINLTQEQNQVKALEANLDERQKLNKNLEVQVTALTNERNKLLTNYQTEQAAHGKTKIERDNYKSKLKNHICSTICPEPCCLGDYERLQNDHKQLQNKLATQKEKILTKINSSLELGLTGQITLAKVITQIKELIAKPPVIAQQRIQQLEQKLVTANHTISYLEEQLRRTPPTPAGEPMAVIIQIDLQNLEQLFRHQLDPITRHQIQASQNYPDLAEVRSNFLAQQTEKNQTALAVIQAEKTDLIKHQKVERIIIISLLAASLFTLGGLLTKLKNLSHQKKEKIKTIS